MLQDTLYHSAPIRVSRQRIYLRQFNKRNKSFDIGGERLHVANSEETVQSRVTGETFSDGQKCSWSRRSV